MHEIWAPSATTVEIEVNGKRIPLEGSASGCRRTDASIPAEVDYWILLDGKRLPDPRSAWQPHGVSGPSRIVDHRRFRWTDQAWQARPLSSAVLYELHIGTFSPAGTFDGAIERLDHLVELGVTHVELMPVAEFYGVRGWGYDGVFPFSPHHAYGGPNGLKRLVDACHSKGLAVILDVVYNHLGPVGNCLPQFAPYFQNFATPWGAAINFDGADSDEVRRYFCDNALMWLRDYHFDGLRLDAVHAIVDRSAHPFLEQLAAEVKSLEAHVGRHFVLIAESDLNDPRVVRPAECGGFGLDAQWCDDIHHALHCYLSGERSGYYADFGELEDLAAAMMRPYVYDGRRSEHRRRRHGRSAGDLPASRFIAFSQNHDQLGNRAQGERLSHLIGDEGAKLAAALVLLSPYVPMLFQGEEWSASSPFQYFVDFAGEPELERAVSEGRRREFASFGWKPEQVPDPTAEATFLASKLDWSELSERPHREMLAWYRGLIELRKSCPDFTDGRLARTSVVADAAARTLRVERGSATIFFNFSSAPRPLGSDDHEGRVVLASRPLDSHDGSSCVAAPLSVVVIMRTPEALAVEAHSERRSEATVSRA